MVNQSELRARQRVLAKLSHKLKQGRLTKHEKEWLADRLMSIALGEDANEVLGVNPGRGVKRKQNQVIEAENKLQIVLGWVEVARKEFGYSVDEACAIADEYFGYSDGTVKKYWGSRLNKSKRVETFKLESEIK